MNRTVTLTKAFEVSDNSIIKISDLYITQCDASYFRSTNLTVENSIFRRNCGSHGGALDLAKSQLHVKNCRFEFNEAAFRGGAIALDTSPQYQIIGSTFRNNIARGYSDLPRKQNTVESDFGGRGGAISSYGEDDENVLEGIEYITYAAGKGSGLIEDSIFSDNKAEIGGGAISLNYITDSLTEMKNCSFYNNSVSLSAECFGGDCTIRGGALHFSNAPASLTHCTFEGNSVISSDIDQAAQGGAIYSSIILSSTSDIESNMIVNNCSFVENSVNGHEDARFVDVF